MSNTALKFPYAFTEKLVIQSGNMAGIIGSYSAIIEMFLLDCNYADKDLVNDSFRTTIKLAEKSLAVNKYIWEHRDEQINLEDVQKMYEDGLLAPKETIQ